MKKHYLAGIAIVLMGFSFLVAQSVAKKRSFTGNVVIQACQRDDAGKWSVVDEVNVNGLKFVTSVAEMAKGKQVSSDLVLSGMSKKGRPFSARLKKAGGADADLVSGRLSLNLPVEVTIDGKKADASIMLSTETAQGAAGAISGRRAVINHSDHTATLALVGSSQFAIPGLEIAKKPEPGPKEEGDAAATAKQEAVGTKKDSSADQKKEPAGQKKESPADQKKPAPDQKKSQPVTSKSDFMFVISGDGKLTALD